MSKCLLLLPLRFIRWSLYLCGASTIKSLLKAARGELSRHRRLAASSPCPCSWRDVKLGRWETGAATRHDGRNRLLIKHLYMQLVSRAAAFFARFFGQISVAKRGPVHAFNCARRGLARSLL